MTQFPRTVVGGVSMPRMICGSNWFLGYSHTSAAKDRFIREFFDRKKIADIIVAFLKYDVDAVMGPASDLLAEAIAEAQDRTGKKVIYVCTPHKLEQVPWAAEKKATFCFPHTSFTDPLIRPNERAIPGIEPFLKAARDHGMIPGLSTHRPEAIICADAAGLDVESYIQPYNCAGFLCHVETDWLASVIRNAKRPVMTIKPLAAGRLLPPTGLAFVWSTLRDIDMVTIGTMSPYEAEEDIEISLALLEKRTARVQLQTTRSKKSLEN